VTLVADAYLPPVISRLLGDISDFLAAWDTAAETAEADAARIVAAQDAASGGPGAGGGGGTAQAVDDAATLQAALDETTVAAEANAAALDDAGASAQAAGADYDTAAAEVSVAAAALDTVSGDAGTAGSAMQDVGLAAEQSAGRIDVLGGSTRGLTQEQQDWARVLEETRAAMDASRATAAEVSTSYDSMGRSVDDVMKAMANGEGSIRMADGSTRSWKQGAEEAAQAAEKLGSSAGQAADDTAKLERASAAGASTAQIFSRALSQTPDAIDGITAAVAVAAPLLIGFSTGLAAMATGAGVVALGIDGMEAALNQLNVGLEPLRVAANDAFEKTMFPAVNEVNKVLPQLTDGVSNVAHSIGDMGRSLADVISSSKGIQQLNDWLAGTTDFFEQGVRGTHDWSDAMLTFLDAAAPAMGKFGEDIADVMTDFDKMIQKAAATGEIADAISGAGDVMKGFGELVTDVASAFMKLSADSGSSVGPALKAIGDALVQAEPAISEWVKGFADFVSIAAKVVTLFDGFKDPLSYIAGALVAIGLGLAVFKVVMSPLTNLVGILWDLGKAWTGAGTAADVAAGETVVAGTAAEGAAGGVATLGAALASFLVEAAPFIIVGLAIAAVAYIIIQDWGPISGFFSDLFGKIGQLFQGFGDILKQVSDWGKNVLDGLFGGMNDGMQSGEGTIGSIVDSIIGGFKNLFGIQSPSTVFAEMGTNIAQGLLQGIEDGASSVIQGIEKLAADIINAAKGALGIQSPSTVFADLVGAEIPAGVGAGIIANAHTATDAARALAAQTVTAGMVGVGAGINAGGGAQLGGGTAGGQETYTLHVGSGSDSAMGTAIAKLIRTGNLTIQRTHVGGRTQ
jgi:phage-related protein